MSALRATQPRNVRRRRSSRRVSAVEGGAHLRLGFQQVVVLRHARHNGAHERMRGGVLRPPTQTPPAASVPSVRVCDHDGLGLGARTFGLAMIPSGGACGRLFALAVAVARQGLCIAGRVRPQGVLHAVRLRGRFLSQRTRCFHRCCRVKCSAMAFITASWHGAPRGRNARRDYD